MTDSPSEAARLRRALKWAMALVVISLATSFSIGIWIQIPEVIAGRGEWVLTIGDLLGILVAALAFPCAFWATSLARRLDALEMKEGHEPRE